MKYKNLEAMNCISKYFDFLAHKASETGRREDAIDVLNGISKNVFSAQIRTADLTGNQKLYLFSLNEQTLFVLLDDYRYGITELADEEYLDDEEPRYFSESTQRISPVHLLFKTAYRVSYTYKSYHVDYDDDHAYFVLVTSSNIINKEEMFEENGYWNREKLAVFDNYKFRPYHRLTVSEDEEAVEKSPVLARNFQKVKEDVEAMDTKEFHGLIDKYVYHHLSGNAGPADEDGDSAESEEDKSLDELLDKFLADIPDQEEEPDDDDVSDDSAGEEDAEDDPDDIFRNSKIYNPQTGDWKDYVDYADTDFYDPNTEKALPVAPHTLLECIQNASTLLDNMIGISDMKAYITSMIGFARYNRLLREKGIHAHDLNLHSVFTGNPGTGKTTLASILGSLLKDAGIISKGHVVMCNRASFCSGKCWGDGEKAVIQLMKIAKGGVLFIDEAYNLISADQRDPGRQVLPNLLTYLADEEYRDLCVVLAGYPKEMQELLLTNPGIESRFPNRFEFKDYSFDELMKITHCCMDKYGYTFTPAARHAYEDHLRGLYDDREPKNWGNARTVANLLEKIYIRHGLRVVNSREKNILKLKVRDIPPYQKPANNVKERRIGFWAGR